MVMFDYQKIWLISGGDSTRIVQYFLLVAFKEPGWEHLVGSDFMVNESIITRNPYKAKAKPLAEYIGLCSLRTYSKYKIYENVNLSMEEFPVYVPREVVEECKWVAIEGDNIVFTEELKTENNSCFHVYNSV